MAHNTNGITYTIPSYNENDISDLRKFYYHLDKKYNEHYKIFKSSNSSWMLDNLQWINKEKINLVIQIDNLEDEIDMILQKINPYLSDLPRTIILEFL